jgi:hypothetical protein
LRSVEVERFRSQEIREVRDVQEVWEVEEKVSAGSDVARASVFPQVERDDLFAGR